MFEIHARTIRRYSSLIMYQTTKVSADRPFSGFTKKTLSHFDLLINATGYVLQKFHSKNFVYSNLDKTLLTENLENKI